ncbi:hypothetical protein FRC17_003210 [Serendipita sp. 399]|nr:hypothetical protein FRC17_003210 [Serendipita sp. 399]
MSSVAARSPPRASTSFPVPPPISPEKKKRKPPAPRYSPRDPNARHGPTDPNRPRGQMDVPVLFEEVLSHFQRRGAFGKGP